jgi:hypothetical protein
MDSMSYRNNRPVQSRNESEHVAPAPAPTTSATAARKSHVSAAKSPKRRFVIVGIVILVLAALVAGWFFFGRSGAAGIDSTKYQAVFFTNGQVYFGKLSQQNGEYMKLSNVYYLQSKNTSTDKTTTPQSASSQNASDVELIKLGNEIHGPVDEMIIAKDQILFFENLKPQGTVSKTITNFQKK